MTKGDDAPIIIARKLETKDVCSLLFSSLLFSRSFLYPSSLSLSGRFAAAVLPTRVRQLVSMVASFPLQWPSQLQDMFNVMNEASGAGFLGGIGLDCQLASLISPESPLLYFRSLVAAKGLVMLGK